MKRILPKQQRGFTLIELMVTVAIIAILAVIAIPSYRQFMVRNAEEDTKAQMMRLELELERWRASALTYKKFVPQNGLDTNAKPVYDYKTNTAYDAVLGAGARLIYVPQGSTDTTHRYAIGLVDGGIDTLTSTLALNSTTATGRSWRAMAVPNPNGPAATGHIIKITSTGLKCQSKDRSVTIVAADCGTGSTNW